LVDVHHGGDAAICIELAVEIHMIVTATTQANNSHLNAVVCAKDWKSGSGNGRAGL
jgi:hypothetical protein